MTTTKESQLRNRRMCTPKLRCKGTAAGLLNKNIIKAPKSALIKAREGNETESKNKQVTVYPERDYSIGEIQILKRR